MHKTGNAHIIYYRSIKLKTMTRSVLASNFFAIVYRDHMYLTIRLVLNTILNCVSSLHIPTDCCSLYNCFTGMNEATEKRLLIDLRMFC